MLDLVENETQRLDSRFLEPACGDGNFLIEILERKLNLLEKNYKNNQYSFEKYSVVTIGSIYGIDILKDNIFRARERLFEKFNHVYKRNFKNKTNPDLTKSLEFILSKNIIHGDALTLKKVESEDLITFCEWSLISDQIKRRDFTFENLHAYAPFEEGTLFSDLGEEVLMPKPLREFELIYFLKVFEQC